MRQTLLQGFPQTVYTANDSSTGVNSILIELDASNTSTTGITATAFIQDTSATLGTISSVVSASDVATVTTATAHGLKTGQYVNVTGSTTNYVNGMYKVASTPSSTTFTYAQNTNADGTAAGTIVIYNIPHRERRSYTFRFYIEGGCWTEDCTKLK